MIWIDLENSPHVLFFEPIIAELKARGVPVFLTARDFAQTVPLMEATGLPFHVVGARAQGGKIRKALALLERGRQLKKLLKREKIRPSVSMGHGSRGHLVGAKMAGIPSITTYDYEYVDTLLHNHLATRVYVPDVLSDDDIRAAGIRKANLHRYPGLKEEVYLRGFQPDPTFCEAAGLDTNAVVVVLRPPSAGSHYHRSEAERLLDRLLDRLLARSDVQLIALPRYPEQREALRERFAGAACNLVMPDKPLDGKNLIYHADAVISGGGTMIREAAVLGVPAYTIFQGEKGGVDRHLSASGRLQFVDSDADVDEIKFHKKLTDQAKPESNIDLTTYFVDELAEFFSSGPPSNISN